MTRDVFGTAALRRAVLEAWRSSPTRLREDANTEEDHAHGSYRGRVVVELAQNAADAAARAGVPGRLRLSLHAPSDLGGRWVLRAANTGEPLDAAGVASLVAMRASATVRGAGAAGGPRTVGRFGVGFAAVRSVADRVRVGAGDRAVELSLDRTRAALDDVLSDRPDLAAEVAGRGDRLPVLRLPFPARVEVPPGYDTVVEVELRDDAALDAVRAELADVGDPLLLALPALTEVVVAGDGVVERRVADVDERWTVLRREGTLDPALLADRPVEERGADRWSVTWALPHDVAAPTVLHAPTPTDERLTFPALLLATFPLDPARRHVPRGAVTDHVAHEAGRAYAALLGSLAADRGADVLGLVPTGLPASAVDEAVRAAATTALARTPLLPLDLPPDQPDLARDDPWGDLPSLAEHDEHGVPHRDWRRLLAPAEARVLAGDVGDARVRAELGAAHLVDVPGPLRAVARSLGAQVVDLADVLDDLPLVADPARWRALYDALAPHAGDRSVLEALGALPVPLLGGQVVRGARGLLLLDDGTDGGTDDGTDGGTLDARDAADLGLRVVDPRAAHPLLERLGARSTDLRAVLADGAVRERVLAAADAAEADDDPAPEVERLLALVAAALRDVRDPGDALPFWWGELPVPTTGGGWSPARGCALPGTWAADALDGLDVVDPGVVARWGEPVLRAVGAAAGPTVLRVRDVLTPTSDDDEPDLDPHAPEGWLSDWAGYLEHLAATLGPEAYVGDVLAVADLDAVAEHAWPDVLARLAGDPAAREALLTPVRAEGGRATAARSYTAWWLREELGGPFALDGGPAAAFLRPAPPEVAGLDDASLAAVGGVHDLAELDPEEWADLLDGLPPVGSRVDARAALALWRALETLAGRGLRLDPPPARVPALHGGAVVVAPAEDVAVAPDPMWAPLRPLVPAGRDLVEDVADLLDVATVTGTAPAPDAAGHREDVPAEVVAVVGAPLPRTWERHDDLRVDGVAVPWWVEGRGGAGVVVHATGSAGLAAALAVVAGRHGARHVLEEVLRDPRGAQGTVARTAWDAPQSSADAR